MFRFFLFAVLLSFQAHSSESISVGFKDDADKCAGLVNSLSDDGVICLDVARQDAQSFVGARALFHYLAKNTRLPASESDPWRSLNDNLTLLVKSRQTLPLTCGKASLLFKQMAVRFLGISPARIRLVNIWGAAAFKATSVNHDKRYLAGGHELLEVYFPSMSKWVVFDTFYGIIPTVGDQPASIMEVTANPFQKLFFNPLGSESFGKGLQNGILAANFYLDARQIIGYQANDRKWYVFFNHPKQQVKAFVDNFNAAYRSTPLLFRDLKKFAKLVAPPPV
jgi:hypothetical protein